MYTNRKKGGGAGWQCDFVEELATEKGRSGRISHGRTRKNTETAKAKTWKKSRKGRRISHGRTRKNTETAKAETRKKSRKEAEELATDEHGKTRKQQKNY
jgi:hypothetical protein